MNRIRAATVEIRAGVVRSTDARIYSRFKVEFLVSIIPTAHYGAM
jgi:hypothetical protein